MNQWILKLDIFEIMPPNQTIFQTSPSWRLLMCVNTYYSETFLVWAENAHQKHFNFSISWAQSVQIMFVYPIVRDHLL